MPKKTGVLLLFFLSLAVSACLSPAVGKKGAPDGGWRAVHAALKKAFGKKHPLALAPTAARAGEQLAATDKSSSARRRLAGDDGFSPQFARTSKPARTSCSGRTHLGDAAVEHAAFILEGDRAVCAVCRRIAIQSVYQPLAVVMPNPRSPPPAASEIS